MRTDPNPQRAWELKRLAAQGMITDLENEEWHRLKKDCTVNHNNPRPEDMDKDSCGNCGAYLG
ncbi:MAG TPA: hypothetical protein VJC12_00970 [Candidatus Paceibacterota bacterium]